MRGLLTDIFVFLLPSLTNILIVRSHIENKNHPNLSLVRTTSPQVRQTWLSLQLFYCFSFFSCRTIKISSFKSLLFPSTYTGWSLSCSVSLAVTALRVTGAATTKHVTVTQQTTVLSCLSAAWGPVSSNVGRVCASSLHLITEDIHAICSVGFQELWCLFVDRCTASTDFHSN